MLQGYLGSAIIGVIASMALTLIWSSFKGLRTILTWAIGACLGVAAWWVFIHSNGAVEVVLTIVLAGVFMAIIDWHRRVIPG